MGDSGAEDTSDSLTESDLDQIARDAEAIQGGRTETQGTVFGVNGVSATGSTERDREIGYSDGRGNPGPNFEAFGGVRNESGEPIGKVAQTPSQFAAALEATQGGDTGTTVGSIGIPTIEAASSTLAPGILGETLSDFQSGVRSDTGRRLMGQDTPANQMLEAAIGTTVPIPNVSRETVVGDRAPGTNESLALSRTLQFLNDARDRRTGLGDERGIDFGVTQQLLPTTTSIAKPNITEEIDDLADTEFAKPGGTGTTATGTNVTDEKSMEFGDEMPTFDVDVDLTDRGLAELRSRKPIFGDSINLFGLKLPLPTAMLINKGVQMSRESIANAIETKGGRPLFNEQGQIVGAASPRGDFLMAGMPGKTTAGQSIGQIGGEMSMGEQDMPPTRAVAPKAPTDPCPDGYQLIDGKCTPVATDDKGTGFITFPPDRTPPFQIGPFEPKTQATDPSSITPLNPLTFGISNIFRR